MDSNNTGTPRLHWKQWLFIAVIAAPLGIILHELGHFMAAKLLGFPDVVLHYASVSNTAEEAGFPTWQLGIQAAAGPLVTVSILLGCCLASYRQGPKPIFTAPAFAVGIRTIGLGIVYLGFRIFYSIEPSSGNFDELNLALHFGMNPDIVVGLNLLVYLAIWVYLIRLMSGYQLWKKLGLIASGTILGIVIYMFIGPFILP